MFQKSISFIQKFPALVIVATVIVAGLAISYGGNVSSNLQGGGFAAKESESTKVDEAIEKEFGDNQAGLLAVFESKDKKSATELSVKNEVLSQVDKIEENDSVTKVESYYSIGAESLLSKDKKKTLVLVTLKGNEDEQAKAADAIQKELRSETLVISFGGSAAINNEITQQIGKDLMMAEIVSFSVLAVLLVIVFRGFIAALLPLVLGGLTIIGAFAVLQLLTNFTPVVEYAMNVIILVGLGLAVDYSLLIISRFREELYDHKNNVKLALARTYHTAGRTVFFSGLTVIISLISLTVFPLDFLRSMGFGGAAAVGVAMLAALVILPAILRLLGTRVNWLSFGSARRAHKAVQNGQTLSDKQSIWYKSGKFFMRRSVSTLVVSIGLLMVATLPVLGIHLASPDEKVLPQTAGSRQVTDTLQRDFGMDSKPFKILYEAPTRLDDPAQIAALYDYTRQLQQLPNVKTVESIVTLPGISGKAAYQQLFAKLNDAPGQIKDRIDTLTHGRQTMITVTSELEVSSDAAKQLVVAIRDVKKPAGSSIMVGGFTAALVDQLDVLVRYLPYALAAIGITLFVLLFLMLGSIVIPIKAMLQNVLSLGAAFGALVLLFQNGVLADVLHLNDTGVIYATLPAMIFAIAFGLSMDYSVFLYSRIKEQYDKTGNSDEAVLMGLQKTGSIITSAAMLLFVVVIAFATSGITIMQQIGVGLALAILLDAFLVRMVLVPATMKLLGKYNWWAPRRLVRLQQKLGLGEKE